MHWLTRTDADQHCTHPARSSNTLSVSETAIARRLTTHNFRPLGLVKGLEKGPTVASSWNGKKLSASPLFEFFSPISHLESWFRAMYGLENLTEKKLIEPVNGAWSPSAVLVKKKNKKWKFYNDYRCLNAVPHAYINWWHSSVHWIWWADTDRCLDGIVMTALNFWSGDWKGVSSIEEHRTQA